MKWTDDLPTLTYLANLLVDSMAEANLDLDDVFIFDNETQIEEVDLQAIKFYLEGVAYTPIAIVGMIGKCVVISRTRYYILFKIHWKCYSCIYQPRSGYVMWRVGFFFSCDVCLPVTFAHIIP